MTFPSVPSASPESHPACLEISFSRGRGPWVAQGTELPHSSAGIYLQPFRGMKPVGQAGLGLFLFFPLSLLSINTHIQIDFGYI